MGPFQSFHTRDRVLGPRLVFDGYAAGIYMVLNLVKEIRYKVGIPSGPYQCWPVLGFCEGSTQKWSLESSSSSVKKSNPVLVLKFRPDFGPVLGNLDWNCS